MIQRATDRERWVNWLEFLDCDTQMTLFRRRVTLFRPRLTVHVTLRN
jgi:hypothetical protein